MDLKSFREDKLKIKTQSDFAALLGVDQSSISRWEKDPSSIPYQIIQVILEKTGASFEELTGWKKPLPKPLNVNNSWEKANFTKHSLADYITSALKDTNISDDHRKEYVDELQKGLTSCLVKPQVTIVGRSDTGKSTLINALLGTEKMPTSWTPTTSIAIYIKHISDKPAFIEEDAWVFANNIGTENMWDERRLYDEDYCRAWKIGAGGVEVLRSFGTRQGENYAKAAGSAVVFIDAPVLNNCDIVDLPGFGTETDSDDEITFSATKTASVIIYLSQANGFMRIEDISYLKRNISELPVWEKQGENKLLPLSNLFIVASQAHTVNNGNREQLTQILDTGNKNLLKTLPDGYWKTRQAMSGYTYAGYGSKELRSRFFAFTTDIPDICLPFNNALKQVLEALPLIIDSRAKNFVREYVKARKPSLTNELQKYEGIVSEREKYVALLDEIERNELSRLQDNDKRKEDIRNEIHSAKDDSISEFSQYMSSTINVDALVQLIKSKGIKNKKEDVELFGSRLQSMIQESCETILSKKSKVLQKKAQEYISAYAESVSRPFENNNISVDFDAGWAFTSALSKLGMIGGLGGLFVSAISGAVMFAGIGISTGTAMLGGLLTSSIFGPIGLGLGLLLAGTLGIIKLFGGGWEKSIAKKIVAEFEKNRYADKFRSGISDFWDNTETAFNKAAAALDDDWERYVENLRSTVNDYDINEIQYKIASLKVVSDFFDNIPL